MVMVEHISSRIAVVAPHQIHHMVKRAIENLVLPRGGFRFLPNALQFLMGSIPMRIPAPDVSDRHPADSPCVNQTAIGHPAFRVMAAISAQGLSTPP
ncbi:hypothetical protein [Rhodopseudomonas palustris]|uniref:hypothetical protein n=1 Tax=Rhodopseudomonas palustris TaxID=1076 RepID=UPI0012EEDC96|nr:hypothetical protein [Rhodopseudomonas palustris]